MKLIKLPSIVVSLTSLSLAFGSFQLPTWRPVRFLSESLFLVVLVLNNSQTATISVTSWGGGDDTPGSQNHRFGTFQVSSPPVKLLEQEQSGKKEL